MSTPPNHDSLAKKFAQKVKKFKAKDDDTSLASENLVSETTESVQVSEANPLIEENEKLNKQLLMLAADYDNYRKRVTKDMEEATKFSITKFAKDLIDVLENLYRAQSSINSDELESNPTLKQIFTGVELTRKSLIDIFERYGIIRVHPLGEEFNHDLHQAIIEVQAPGFRIGTVAEVIQAGYTLHGRLLRPALVAVAKE